MQLTRHTDFAFRVLIHLSMNPDRLVTISELAKHFAISRNHLVKVVHNLGKAGFISTVRGKNGGMRLARAPTDLKIGEVIRAMEPGFAWVECMGKKPSQCAVLPVCGLRFLLHRMAEELLVNLDLFSVADILNGALIQAGRDIAQPLPD